LEAVTSAAISRFVATLRTEGMKPITIASVLGYLRPALSWAVSMGLLRKMPEVKKPHRSKGQAFMRGRPTPPADDSRRGREGT
jgi:site-specific recombinase XerC